MRSRHPRIALSLLASLLTASLVSAQVSSGKYTYAVESNGVVCGYADVTLTPAEDESGRYTLFRQHTVVMQSALGSEFNSTVDLTYHIDPVTGDYSYMHFDIQQAEVDLTFEVRIDGRTATCTSNLRPEEEVIELPDDVILENPICSPHLLGDFAEGKIPKITYGILDGREFEIQHVTCTYAGTERLQLAGATYDTFIVDILNQNTGAKLRTWLDSGTGMTVKVHLPMGRDIYLADPSIRKRIELANMDESILARTNVSISDIHGISYMKVRAVIEPTGAWITPEDLNVPGQRFDGTVTDNLIEGVFEIKHPHYDGTGAPAYPPPPVEDESLRAYIEPSDFIESGDPVLIAKARELATGSSDSWEAARRLAQWVADEIAYEIPGGGTARRTYDLRAGECGSHSILLAAFCRGLGIPARVVWGCMYTPNYGGAFGQHAWTEVHMGDAGWIPVDSTAAQASFVDSGHVRLGELDSMGISLNAKDMEILDYQVASSEEQASMEAEGDAFADYLGQYGPPDDQAMFKVLVSRGNLAIDIRGERILTFKDADDEGRWYCTLTNNLFCTFERDDAGRVETLSFHELIRMRRVGDPEALAKDTPADLMEYLGDYRFPGRPDPFVVSLDDGRLTIWYESRQSLVHLKPTGEANRWIDEFGGNYLTFDRDDEGAIRALILEVVSTIPRW